MQIASHASAGVLAALIGLASGNLARGAEGGLRFEHLSAEDGLSDSRVQCILKDSRGFVWIGTADGLNRYDGSSIKIYRHDPNDPYSLANSTVGVLFEDSKKRLWIGGWRAGGLALYDREKDRFVRYAWEGGPHGLGSQGVNAIAEDSEGRLWLGTPATLDLFAPETGTFTHFAHDPSDAQSLPSPNGVTCLLEDWQHRIWVGTPDGLARLDPKTGKFTRQPLAVAAGGGHEYPAVADLYLDRERWVWVATAGDGLIRFDAATGKAKRYLPDPKNPDSINRTQIRVITGDGQGWLYVGTENGGLNVLDTRTERFRHYLQDPEDDTTLSSNSVWALRRDDQGILWIGTFNGGVQMLTPIGQRFHNIRARRDALSNPHITAVLEDRQGVLWIATDGGGLNRLDRRTNRFTYFVHDPTDPESINDDAVIALHEDRTGAIWAAMWQGGLKRLDPRSGRWRRFRHDDRDPDSIVDNTIWQILEDENGEFVLATFKGVDFFDPRTGKATRCSRRYPGAGARYCNAVARDRHGDYWFALDYGVEHVEVATGKVTHFTADSAKPQGLGGEVVRVLHLDSRGNLWLGTAGAGLNCVTADGDNWRRYTAADGLPGDSVVSIQEDASGALWLGTNQGLSRLRDGVHVPSQPYFDNFDVRDGLPGQEFQRRAAFRSQRDELFFGGHHGLTSFSPKDIVPNLHEPPVVITSLKLPNRPIGIGERGSPLQKDIADTDLLTLSYMDSMVTFGFAALDYFVPRKNLYQCRLEGFDPAWRSLGTQRSVTYTNLSPGWYVLRVRGTNNDAIWSTSEASLRIRVLPPFWETTWFLALAALAALAALFGGHRWRVATHRTRARELAHKVEQRTADLKREVAEHKLTAQRLQTERDLRHALMERELLAEERTRIARELHDSLAQNFAGLSLQLEAVAADLPPDAAEPQASLEVASRMVRHCQTEAHRAVWELRSPVGQSAPLKQTLELALAQLRQTAKPCIQVEVDPEDIGLHPQMQREVVRIAEEAVTNAVKHAAAGHISVTCTMRAEDVWLDVHDDGQGFEYDEGAAAPVGRFGLLGMRERAARINGRLDIVSRPGAGTWVSLRCPEGLLPPRLRALREKIRRARGLDGLGVPSSDPDKDRAT
jgi:signal transduction histidine kinase/ligand-binding sensor domain-containing protein